MLRSNGTWNAPGTGGNILKPSSKQPCRYSISTSLWSVISSAVLNVFRISAVSLASTSGF
jgi:hypothetical protein